MSVLDCAAIQRRRYRAGLSQREVAKALGVTAPTIAALERGTNHLELRVRQLLLLAEVLRCTPSDLFEHDLVGGVPGTQDVRAEALLADRGRYVHREDLAEALGLTLSELRPVLEALAVRLEGTGQRLLVGGDGRYKVRLAPRERILSPLGRLALERAELARNGLKLSTARVLADIVEGRAMGDHWEQNLSNWEKVARGELVNQGLAEPRGGRMVPTEQVAFSLGTRGWTDG